MNGRTVILTLAAAAALAGLTACGGGNTKAPGANTTTSGQPTTSTTASTRSTTTPAQGGGLAWGDMPIYPGAAQVQKGSWSVPPSDDGDYSTFEWRYYETTANLETISEFYKREMPSRGWEQTAWMDLQQMQWGSYMKNNENDAAMVWVSSEGGKTVLAMWRGTK